MPADKVCHRKQGAPVVCHPVVDAPGISGSATPILRRDPATNGLRGAITHQSLPARSSRRLKTCSSGRLRRIAILILRSSIVPGNVLTISRRLGHSSPTITLGVYGHLFANTDDQAAQIMERAFGRLWE